MTLNNFVIKLDERYDSNNAPEFEEQMMKYAEEINKTDPEHQVVLDAENLTYIASAGLRVLLKFKKEHDNTVLINACLDVYNVLDIAGFVEMFDAKLRYLRVDISNGEEIGHGLSSRAIRINGDTIVKVYNPRVPLWKIERECANVKKAFLAGIETIIGFTVVNVEDYYGIVCELVDSEVLSGFLNNHPDQFEEYTDKYIDLLKHIHSTEVDDTFIDVQPMWHEWTDMLAKWVPENEREKIHALISAVPSRNTMIHSDIHVNNIMTGNGNLVLIDMADIGRGHPIFDIGPICFHYKYMEIADREMTDNLIVLNHDDRLRLWDKIKEVYLADPDPDRHKALIEIYECFGAIRTGLIAAKHSQLEDEKKQIFCDTMRKELFTDPEKIDRVLGLMKKYL